MCMCMCIVYIVLQWCVRASSSAARRGAEMYKNLLNCKMLVLLRIPTLRTSTYKLYYYNYHLPIYYLLTRDW